MRRRPAPPAPGPSITVNKKHRHHSDIANLPDQTAPAQYGTPPKPVRVDTIAQADIANGGIHCGAIWKSPRDKSACIQATLREFNGHQFLDCRLHRLDGAGRMKPTTTGITVSLARLGQFSQLIGNAYRRAAKLGLITAVSS